MGIRRDNNVWLWVGSALRRRRDRSPAPPGLPDAPEMPTSDARTLPASAGRPTAPQEPRSRLQRKENAPSWQPDAEVRSPSLSGALSDASYSTNKVLSLRNLSLKTGSAPRKDEPPAYVRARLPKTGDFISLGAFRGWGRKVARKIPGAFSQRPALRRTEPVRARREGGRLTRAHAQTHQNRHARSAEGPSFPEHIPRPLRNRRSARSATSDRDRNRWRPCARRSPTDGDGCWPPCPGSGPW